MKTVLVSAVAMVDSDGRVLLNQRPAGKHLAGMWEFPGGKVEAGETPEAALIREIREELGVKLCDHCFAPVTFVSHAYDDFHLLMMLYIARRWEGTITPMEGQNLCWRRPGDMHTLPMPPADLPLVAALIDQRHVWEALG